MIFILIKVGRRLGHSARVAFHYLTGCTRRLPLVQILAAFSLAFFIMGVGGNILTGSYILAGFVAAVLLLSVLYYRGALRPVADDLDADPHPGALPAVYPVVEAVGQVAFLFLIAIPFSFASLVTEGLVAFIPLTLVIFASPFFVHWVAADLDNLGPRTLAGDIRRAASALRRPDPTPAFAVAPPWRHPT